MSTISLADAKAKLSSLVDQVEAGGTIEITRRGKVVARLVGASPPREAIDMAFLEAATETMPNSTGSAARLVRSMRDGDRY